MGFWTLGILRGYLLLNVGNLFHKSMFFSFHVLVIRVSFLDFRLVDLITKERSNQKWKLASIFYLGV